MATSLQQKDPTYDRGLPSNVYAERMVLGSVLLNDEKFVTVAAGLEPDDFSLDKHRKIYRRMLDLQVRGDKIDHVTPPSVERILKKVMPSFSPTRKYDSNAPSGMRTDASE